MGSGFRFGFVRVAWGHTYNPHSLYNSILFFRESDRMGRGVCSTSNTVRGSLLQQGPNASATTIGKSIVMADSW